MKLIDWAKVPRGTMTNKGEIIYVHMSVATVLLYDEEGIPSETNVMPTQWLRIVPATSWTYHEGGECPVPEGLTFDFITRAGFEWNNGDTFQWEHTGSNSDTIAYRITGVDRAGGFTDDTEEVTE